MTDRPAWLSNKNGPGMEDALDELVAAVVRKLPAPGRPFPGEQRAAWLKMMAMAFDVAYGVTDELPPFLLSSRELTAGFERNNEIVRAVANGGPSPLRLPHAGHTFYIDDGGNALQGECEPVFAATIPADEIIFDYRPVTGEFRDLESIVWADGSRGTSGLPAGISFCGPG